MEEPGRASREGPLHGVAEDRQRPVEAVDGAVRGPVRREPDVAEVAEPVDPLVLQDDVHVIVREAVRDRIRVRQHGQEGDRE